MAEGLPQPGGTQRSQTKFIVFENFEKMNTQAARQGLSEKELAWLENLQPIAPNKLTTVPAPAAAALADIIFSNPIIDTFATVGSFTWTAPPGVTSVNFLVVAGGGGGGGDAGGGGGGGGIIISTLTTVPGASYPITVGGGGIAGTAVTNGGNGNNSVFATFTAIGGGGGGTGANAGNNGAAGGSGGGGGGSSVTSTTGGAGTAGQGQGGGGNNVSASVPGGGGGGAGVAGATAPSTTAAGAGGGGASSAISGILTVYCGGGGGGAAAGATPGAGGTGGGGVGTAANSSTSIGVSGIANLGGGGGGGANSGIGGNGGAGVVILSYTFAENELIPSIFYADIGGVDYFIAFSVSGAAYAVNISTGAVGNFAPDGTFSSAPDVTTWQASRILINDSQAGYCTFDGILFVHQGGVSPNITVTAGGTGYGTPPTVTISGGSGSGATAVSVVENGEIIDVNLTAPGTGYLPGDTLTVGFGTSAGSGATGHVTMTGAPVSSISIVNEGAWQVSPTQGTHALTFSGGGGTGAAGTVTVATRNQRFIAQSVTLTAPGSGYSSPPSCTLSVSTGTAPTFNVVLGTQSVATIVLDTQGTLYAAPPAVEIVGGGGSGATAVSTESGGNVTSLTLTNGGSGYTSTPIVIIGAGTGATAIAHVWPFVPAGTTLAVFQGRVWLAGGTLLQWTGTGSTYGDVGYDDFLATDASGSTQITDADLVHAITALRSLNNYLFIMGDQSVKQIGNISLDSSGLITLFTILTLSSDQGTIFPKSCISYNRIFLFANQNGIYGVFGSSVQKLSSDMDGIFELVNFAQPPQGAVMDLNAIHNAVFLVSYNDPLSVTRSIILVFDGKRWYPINQGAELLAIASAPNATTGDILLYGSSGNDITQLVESPTTPVTFKIQSALTHHGNAVQGKKVIRAGFAAMLGTAGQLTMSIDADNTSNVYTMNLPAGFALTGGSNDANNKPIANSGVFVGMTLTGTLAGLTFTNLILETQETSLWKGS